MEEQEKTLTSEELTSVLKEFSAGVPMIVEETSEEDPLIPSPYLYSGVEEVPLLGGTLYVAVKHGSAIVISVLPNKYIKVVVTAETSPDTFETVEYVSSNVCAEAKEYWEELVSPYIDTEVEPVGGYTEETPEPAIARPGQIPPGYRKTKRVGSNSEVACVLRKMTNTKTKNRSRNKAASKSRAKNRR